MAGHMLSQLVTSWDVPTGRISGVAPSVRRLSDLRGVFADEDAYRATLALGDPTVYTVAAVEPASGDGQLHYALATLMPGRVGAEYYLTKGHLHAWRPAAEVYIGISGEGALLLEHERGGECRLVPLTPNSAVYVPGYTAHRTINTGAAPLVYLGVYPAAAGHDYASVAERSFAKVLIERDGQPQLLDRAAYLAELRRGGPAEARQA